MTSIQAQLIGYPRIGPNRELKWTLERAWSGRIEGDALATRINELREAHLREQRDAVGSAVDDFFLYDEVLETALMLGVVPDGKVSGGHHTPTFYAADESVPIAMRLMTSLVVDFLNAGAG